MSRTIMIVLASAALLALIVLSNTLFTVNQIEQGLVLQFGRPIRTIEEPGLKAKIPFTQSVVLYDRRVLDYELPAEEVIASDQKRIVCRHLCPLSHHRPAAILSVSRDGRRDEASSRLDDQRIFAPGAWQLRVGEAAESGPGRDHDAHS